jgi:integrase
MLERRNMDQIPFRLFTSRGNIDFELINSHLYRKQLTDELLNLTLDCLDQDAEGDFWIKFRIFKIKKDHRLPITRELAAEIQEQQQEIKKIWGNEINVLFPTVKGKPFSQCSVRRNLNEIGLPLSQRERASNASKEAIIAALRQRVKKTGRGKPRPPQTA